MRVLVWESQMQTTLIFSFSWSSLFDDFFWEKRKASLRSRGWGFEVFQFSHLIEDHRSDLRENRDVNICLCRCLEYHRTLPMAFSVVMVDDEESAGSIDLCSFFSIRSNRRTTVRYTRRSSSTAVWRKSSRKRWEDNEANCCPSFDNRERMQKRRVEERTVEEWEWYPVQWLLLDSLGEHRPPDEDDVECWSTSIHSSDHLDEKRTHWPSLRSAMLTVVGVDSLHSVSHDDHTDGDCRAEIDQEWQKRMNNQKE